MPITTGIIGIDLIVAIMVAALFDMSAEYFGAAIHDRLDDFKVSKIDFMGLRKSIPISTKYISHLKMR